VYAATLALVGLTLAWLWQGARTRGLTSPGVSPAIADYLMARTLVSPLIFLLSIGVAFLSVTLASYTPLLIFPANAAVSRRYAHAISDPD